MIASAACDCILATRVSYPCALMAPWAVNLTSRGRFVGGTPRKPDRPLAWRSGRHHPAIPSPEPNRALSGRPQPLPASSEASIGETGFEPATARPPAGCATRLRHSPWHYRAGDGNRTRPRSLEGFCAATTLRPQAHRHVTGVYRSGPAGRALRASRGAPRSAHPPRSPPSRAGARARTSCRGPRRVSRWTR